MRKLRDAIRRILRSLKWAVKNLVFMYRYRDRSRPRIIYALTPPPWLSNIGDHAQVVAVRRWLEAHFGDLPVVELDKTESVRLLPALRRIVAPHDIVVLHSGGNLGDRGIYSESARRTLIGTFTRNSIISLPQTIFFSDTPNGRMERERTRTIYAGHPALTVIGRDPESTEIARRLFPHANVLKAPDFVLSLPPRTDSVRRTGKALLCLRHDDESLLNENDLAEIERIVPYDGVFFDTVLPHRIPERRRSEILDRVLDLFSSVDVVITDRFHGLIFAVLCRRPCVVLRTVDHKLTSAIEWFREIPNVCLAESVEQIPEAIAAVSSRRDDYPDWHERYFNPLAAALKRDAVAVPAGNRLPIRRQGIWSQEENMLVQDFLHERAVRSPQKEALKWGATSLTFEQFEVMSDRIARGLTAGGIRRGERVVLHLDNPIETAVCIFGVLKAGAVVVVMGPMIGEDELGRVIKDYQSSGLIVPAEKEGTALRLEYAVRSLSLVMLTGRIPEPPARSGWYRYETIVSCLSSGAPSVCVVAQDPACLLHASGENGTPCDAIYGHDTLAFTSERLIETLEIVSSDIVLNAMPLSSVYGLCQLIAAIRAGATTILESTHCDADVLREVATREQVTGILGAPALVAALPQHDGGSGPGHRWPLRYLAVPGVTNPGASLSHLWGVLPDVRIVTISGPAECSFFLYLDAGRSSDRPLEVGVPIPITAVPEDTAVG